MNIEPSRRLAGLPPYPFAEIDKKKKAAIAQGKDVISLGVGDPDLPTPAHIVAAAREAVADPKKHHYPFEAGTIQFREAVAGFYSRRFGVSLDPQSEVRATLGSKDGLAHCHFAFVNPGDAVLVPDPGYPVYGTGTRFADGEPVLLPLTREKSFLPDLDAVPATVLSRARLLFVNSPNNPTAAVADAAFFEKAIRLAKKYGFIIAHDAAYSEIYFDRPPISFLSVPGAKDVGVEFHSCSKTYNMTGWRIGWFCGNAEIVGTLGRLKDNFDSGVFEAIQAAGVAALAGPQDCVAESRSVYRERRDVLVGGLKRLGWSLDVPQASFYVWVRNPPGYTSAAAVERLIEEAAIVAVPGRRFGPHGEGYLRFALTVPKDRIEAALERLVKIRW